MRDSSVQPLDARIKELNHLHDSCSFSWRKIAALPDFLGIPAGTLCAVAKGREPKKAAHRNILGLPPLAVPIEPCINPTCDGYGQPHTYDCQTQAVIEKTAETKRINRKPQIRLAATVTEEQRQALHELAAAHGLTWSQYCQQLAVEHIKENQ